MMRLWLLPLLISLAIAQEEKPFQKLLLVTNLTPMNFQWKDLGVQGNESFVSPLNQSWVKWFQEHLPPTVKEVVACENVCLDQLASWIESKEGEGPFKEEVIAKVELNLRRHEDGHFEWEGGVIYLDGKTRKSLGSSVIPGQRRLILSGDAKAMNSSLANSLYRAPLSGFETLNKQLKGPVNARSVRLVISGHQNLGDVLALEAMLKARGPGLVISTAMQSFGKEQAELLVTISGEEKAFTDFLSGIKELKSSHSYTVSTAPLQNAFSIKLLAP